MKDVPSYPESCPCKGCDHRYQVCHDECQAYAQFRRDVERFNKYRREKVMSYVLGLTANKKRRR